MAYSHNTPYPIKRTSSAFCCMKPKKHWRSPQNEDFTRKSCQERVGRHRGRVTSHRGSGNGVQRCVGAACHLSLVACRLSLVDTPPSFFKRFQMAILVIGFSQQENCRDKHCLSACAKHTFLQRKNPTLLRFSCGKYIAARCADEHCSSLLCVC